MANEASGSVSGAASTAADPRRDVALHVVFGAGQIGAPLAALLQARGLRVRVVRKSAKPVPGVADVVVGDARDPAFAADAVRGAAVVHHCLNASAYTAASWEQEFLPMGTAILAAATQAGARLVVLDNLYGYGVVDGPRTEATPMAAPERAGGKARVRIAWDAVLRTAIAQGARVVVGRAGDFFGPGTEQAVLPDAAVRGLVAGQRPWLLGDPSAVHAFSYAPDVVHALCALGTADDDVEGRVFHLPVLPVAPAALLSALADALGTTTKHRRASRTFVTLMGPFVPMLRALRETMYQWDRPFLVDDAAFRSRFPGSGTTLDEAVRATAAHARATAPATTARTPAPARA